MNDADLQRIDAFIQRWTASSGNERANAQPFFLDLCDALGVDRPHDKGRIPGDPYCFEKDIKFYSPNGTVTSKFIDFYKVDHFLIEAKQGGTATGQGTAKRGTQTYRKAMEAAFVQAIAYVRNQLSLRDILRTHGGEWTLPQLQAQFKTATRQTQAILNCLDTLETLGIVTRHEQNGVSHWYLSDLQKAS